MEKGSTKSSGIWTEEQLNEKLTEPSARLIEDIRKTKGDILVVGAGGKMGPSLAVLAKRAIDAAGTGQKVTAVSRFTDEEAVKFLGDNNIEMVRSDLLEYGAVDSLPEAENVIYMAGKKFGTVGGEPMTWAMNSYLPALIAQRYKNSRIVAFSSGNIYPMVSISGGGASEDETKPEPIGEYGMSCLGRERAFEYGSQKHGTPVVIFRLNYAIDLRYGVLFDIADSILSGRPISLRTPCFNCIWQADANEMAIRSLIYADSPAKKLNITGPETVSVEYAAKELSRYLGKSPLFEGEKNNLAYLSNASKAMELFGYPQVTLNEMIRWQAQWILGEGRALNKPTHFEERKGSY